MIQTTSKSKFLLIGIIILLLANIALLAFFISGKEHGKKNRHEERKMAIAAFLKNDIGFDQHQLQAFDSLSDAHGQKIKALFDLEKKNKEQQLQLLAKENYRDSSINKIAAAAAEKQKFIGIQMLRHIKNIRGLCTAQQQPVFDSLFYKVFSSKDR